MKTYSFNVTRIVRAVTAEPINIPAFSDKMAAEALDILMQNSGFEHGHSWEAEEEYEESLRETDLIEEGDLDADTIHDFVTELEEAGLDTDEIMDLLCMFHPPASFLRFLDETQQAKFYELIESTATLLKQQEFLNLMVESEDAEENADDPPPTAEELAAEARYQEFKRKLGLHYKGPYPYLVAQSLSLPVEELQQFVRRYEREEGVSIG